MRISERAPGCGYFANQAAAGTPTPDPLTRRPQPLANRHGCDASRAGRRDATRRCAAFAREAGWRTFWLARRAGKKDWAEATTPQEAIRKATSLPPKKRPAWLDQAVAEARRQLDAASVANPEGGG